MSFKSEFFRQVKHLSERNKRSITRHIKKNISAISEMFKSAGGSPLGLETQRIHQFESGLQGRELKSFKSGGLMLSTFGLESNGDIFRQIQSDCRMCSKQGNAGKCCECEQYELLVSNMDDEAQEPCRYCPGDISSRCVSRLEIMRPVDKEPEYEKLTFNRKQIIRFPWVSDMILRVEEKKKRIASVLANPIQLCEVPLSTHWIGEVVKKPKHTKMSLNRRINDNLQGLEERATKLADEIRDWRLSHPDGVDIPAVKREYDHWCPTCKLECVKQRRVCVDGFWQSQTMICNRFSMYQPDPEVFAAEQETFQNPVWARVPKKVLAMAPGDQFKVEFIRQVELHNSALDTDKNWNGLLEIYPGDLPHLFCGGCQITGDNPFHLDGEFDDSHNPLLDQRWQDNDPGYRVDKGDRYRWTCDGDLSIAVKVFFKRDEEPQDLDRMDPMSIEFEDPQPHYEWRGNTQDIHDPRDIVKAEWCRATKNDSIKKLEFVVLNELRASMAVRKSWVVKGRTYRVLPAVRFQYRNPNIVPIPRQTEATMFVDPRDMITIKL